jgi:hypothetical protein
LVVVEDGDQAVVTTMPPHVDIPPRRYPWGRPESKYIESPDSSACSWPSIEAYEPDRRLRLRADLKLPGHGWLEFQVTPLDDGQRSLIRQTATFDPRGLLGRAYWYVLLPVHEWMFSGLLHEIARRGGLAPGCAIERCEAPMTHERIRLGISACLLGEPVRFDGGHKRDPFLSR